jgi:hypothetical protein
MVGVSVRGTCGRSVAWSRRGAFVALFVSLIFIAGCGSDRAYAPVSGVVTFEGKPLAGGTVNFQPVAKSGTNIAGKGSNALCDSDGRFELMTVDGKPGAAVGEHRVRIYGPKTGQIAASDDSGVGTKEIIPRRYNFDTELTITVTAQGSDAANFDLKK